MGLLAITVVMRDQKNKKSSLRAYMVSGTTLATATTAAGTLAEYAEGLSLGVVDSIQISADVDIPSAIVGNTPNANSDVEEKGRFLMRTAAGKTMRVSIPAWNETRTLSGTNAIDLTDADVVNFTEWFTNNAAVCDSNGEAIDSVLQGYEAYN